MREQQQFLKGLSRQLRKRMTDAEQMLWQRFRNHQLGGSRFRRQVVIGPYIVDFLCLERKLVVEVDGGQHLEASAADLQRDEFLMSQGYRVLRFWNNDVMQNMEGVLVRVLEALASPHPNLYAQWGAPPQAGEGAESYATNIPSSAFGGGVGWGQQTRGDTA